MQARSTFLLAPPPLDGYFQGMGEASAVGCNSTVTQGPDYIYTLLELGYPVHNLILTISTQFLAQALSPCLYKVLKCAY